MSLTMISIVDTSTAMASLALIAGTML